MLHHLSTIQNVADKQERMVGIGHPCCRLETLSKHYQKDSSKTCWSEKLLLAAEIEEAQIKHCMWGNRVTVEPCGRARQLCPGGQVWTRNISQPQPCHRVGQEEPDSLTCHHNHAPLTNKQTDRQTDRWRMIEFLAQIKTYSHNLPNATGLVVCVRSFVRSFVTLSARDVGPIAGDGHVSKDASHFSMRHLATTPVFIYSPSLLYLTWPKRRTGNNLSCSPGG